MTDQLESEPHQVVTPYWPAVRIQASIVLIHFLENATYPQILRRLATARTGTETLNRWLSALDVKPVRPYHCYKEIL